MDVRLMPLSDAKRRQSSYYERTARDYQADHVRPGDEHSIALHYIADLARVVGAKSVLDVGAGTGRGLRYLAELRPDLEVMGIEPVEALRMEAEALGTRLLDGSGERLPFADDEFDLVISTGVLHHVEQPSLVVNEMLRVARLGVMISDSNRFGQGRSAVKVAKVLACLVGLWDAFILVRTQGRRYMESEGDGIFYSYSIFDSMPQISAWAARTFVIPTKGQAEGLFGAYLGASHGLLVGLRDGDALKKSENQRAITI